MSTLGNVTWGSAPGIPVSFTYDSYRSGADMVYTLYVTVGTVTGGSYFGYPIYMDLTFEGTKTVSRYTLKGVEPDRWTSAITYSSITTVRNKTGGSTSLKIRLYSGGGSDRDTQYSYFLPVSSYSSWGGSSGGSSGGGSSSGSGSGSGITGNTPQYTRPDASLRVALLSDNDTVNAWGVGVQGYSRLQYTISATAQTGAAITDYAFSFAGQHLSGDSGATGLLTVAGSLTPTARVTDSHGMATTVSAAAVTVYGHSLPRLRATYAYRCDENGAETEQGAYLRVSALGECSPIGGRNTVAVRVRWRPMGGSYGAYVPLTNGVAATVGGALTAGVSYEVELSAVDALGAEKAVSYTSSSAQVTLHLRDGGDGAAFGKKAEETVLGCAWDASFDGSMAVAGELACGGLTVGGKTLLDMVYPVGAVYISLADSDPAGLFGGTWEQIQARFLLAAGSDAEDETVSFTAGTQGGAYSHTLELAQMPRHNHGYTMDADGNHCHALDDRSAVSSSGSGVIESWGSGTGGRGLTTAYGGSHSHELTIDKAGGGQPFSLMPAYLAVYMWKRTA